MIQPLIIFVGASQMLNLTTNNTDTKITCDGETVIYTCTATDLIQIQWIAEPYISATDASRVIGNFPGALNIPISFGPATLFHRAVTPLFITELILTGSTARAPTVVTCSTVTQQPPIVETELYQGNGEIT